MNKDLILSVKVLLVIYLIFVIIIPNKSFLKFLNMNIIKFIILILIAVTSFYDITLSVLLTVMLLANMILYETDNIKQFKPISLQNEFTEKDMTKQIQELQTKNNEKTRPYFLPADEDAIYKSGMHRSLNDLLPDTSKMGDMQTNVFNEKYLNKYISPLEGQYDNQGVAPITGYESLDYF
jgi:hypothetical protein